MLTALSVMWETPERIQLFMHWIQRYRNEVVLGQTNLSASQEPARRLDELTNPGREGEKRMGGLDG